MSNMHDFHGPARNCENKRDTDSSEAEKEAGERSDRVDRALVLSWTVLGVLKVRESAFSRFRIYEGTRMGANSNNDDGEDRFGGTSFTTFCPRSRSDGFKRSSSETSCTLI